MENKKELEEKKAMFLEVLEQYKKDDTLFINYLESMKKISEWMKQQ
ncbi:hypothetical protein MNB_SM-3-1268 [hydrothermal vent metagenome]|uniref:Uncharacterized protein n=1 Tax=hydrothermal vent metagenome TaxID=652676 RepID=A0A1W1D3H0_9ZZZZ